MTNLRALLLLGAVELVVLAVLGWWPAAHRFPLPGLAVFAVAFAAYALAAGVSTRWGEDTDGPQRAGQRRIIWLFAIALRLALLPLTPELSDDVYRYLWDGHVQLSGVNPYLFAPGASELDALTTSFRALVNNPTVPTIYPPLAQVAFLLIAMAGSSILVVKLLWLTCDLATGLVLARTARETGRDEETVLLLYLWAPLLVVEVAWSGHLEPLGLLALALAILWAHRAGRARTPRPEEDGAGEDAPGSARAGGRGGAWASGVALGLSTVTKLAPAAALPALARRLGWRPLVAFAATVGILYLPYAGAGTALFTGLRTYGEQWWFMKGAFGLLELAAGDPDRARLLAGLGVLLVVGWTVYARFDVERALLWTLGAGMILTPTLHPWYVLWMLPMAALRGARAWIALSGLAFIGYFGLTGHQETGVWPQPLFARLALWGPFFALLTLDARRMLRSDDDGALGAHGGGPSRGADAHGR